MNKVPPQNNLKLWLIALLLPVLAWMILNQIWMGRFLLGSDSTDYFYWFIYYFKNILKGVYPLWNPFKSWGCLDYVDTQYIGICNPLSMIIPILLAFGVKAYWAYASYIMVFWMMGFLGFFFLIKRIYNDPRMAWVGTSLLMFSSGLAIFFSWELLGLYIFAPIGWFFGFLIGFVRSSDDAALKRNLFGLTFSVMFLVHLYIPFYFFTVFFAFIVSVLLFGWKWFIQFLGACQRAFKRMPWAILFCFVSVLFAFWPTADCYLKMKDPQNITKFFRGANENSSGNAMDVSQQMIDIGGLPSRGTISDLFSSYQTGDHYLSFIPLVLFIFALLTLFNRSSRGQLVIFMMGFFLLLITITNACPVGHFLYKYLFVFRLFRNYFLFWIPFWACCVVFVMGEMKRFLEKSLDGVKEKILYALWVILVHAGFIVYLISLEDVPMVSYVTIVASCLWFLARLFKGLRARTGLFVLVLVFIGLWQPFYVLPLIRGVDHSDIDYVRREQPFSFERPLFGSGYNELNALANREKYFQDESGFVQNGYMGQKGSYALVQNFSKAALADYVRYKFILYDQTSYISEKNIDWERVRRVIAFQDRFALIEDQTGVGGNGASQPIILKGPDPDFKVIHFDVNSITLAIHLDQRKFLVYNDSYHSGWHALIDRRPVKLFQANIAFKGIWIEPGSHLVRFYFGSWFDYFRGLSVSLMFMFWFFLVITVFLPSYRRRYDQSDI